MTVKAMAVTNLFHVAVNPCKVSEGILAMGLVDLV